MACDSIKSSKKHKRKLRALTIEEVFNQQSKIKCSSLNSPLSKIVLTPHSAEACLRHGINPETLRTREFSSFWEQNIEPEKQWMLSESYSKRREELMKIARNERKKLEEQETLSARKNQNNQNIPNAAQLTPDEILEGQKKANATFIEIEQRRLGKARNRREKELVQILQFESKAEQIKTGMKERADRESRKEEKLLKDKQRKAREAAEERRLRELRKKAQQDAVEEVRRLASMQRFEKEKKVKIENEQKEMEVKTQIRMLEKERMKKLEHTRIEMERKQKLQIIEADKKRELREVQEEEREALVEWKRKNELKMKEERQKEVMIRLERNFEAARKHEEERKKTLLKKQEQIDKLQEEKQEEKRKEQEEKQKLNDLKDRCRDLRLKATRSNEDKLKESLRHKFETEQERIQRLTREQRKERQLTKERKELQKMLKTDNVERIKRSREYHRNETLKKVSDNDKRIQDMMEKKQKIIELRLKAAYEAKIEKDRIVRLLEQAKTSGRSSIKKVITQLVAPKNREDKNGAAKTKKRKKKVKNRKPNMTPNSPSSSQDIFDNDDKEFLNLLPQPCTTTQKIVSRGNKDICDNTGSSPSIDEFKSPYL